ncbi:MAG: lipid A phosphoethanolamine transferase [Prevotella sp.]|nr:lipid A phosphoethanolamine transferase [Prevotella sp.]
MIINKSFETFCIRFYSLSDKVFPAFPHRRIWWLVVWILCMAGIADIPGTAEFELSAFARWSYTVCVGALKALVLICTVGWIWKVKPLRWILYPLFVIFAIISIVNVGCWSFYGFGISRKMIQLVALTNPGESSEFISELGTQLCIFFSSFSTWCGLAVILFCLWLFTRVPPCAFRYVTGLLCISGLVIYGWLAINFNTGRTAVALSVRIPKYYLDMTRANRELRELINSRPPLPYADAVRSSHAAMDVVVIFGESAQRENLSLYGFELPTSPQMDARSDSLFIFTDALSSSSLTYVNMQRLLSFQPDSSPEDDWIKFPSMIDLFKKAGYTTYWISNQEKNGEGTSATGALSSVADVKRYVGREYFDDSMLVDHSYDDKVLPVFKYAMSDSCSARLIMLHLQGSHFMFARRYPQKWARFSASDVLRNVKNRPWLNADGAQLLAEYSNSILFTDFIWGEIASTVASDPRPAILIYLSDHGQMVSANGTNTQYRDDNVARVPFVVYANKAYRNANTQLIERIRSAQSRPFSTASLVHILISLTGTSYPLYDSAVNPFDSAFSAQHRYFDSKAVR